MNENLENHKTLPTPIPAPQSQHAGGTGPLEAERHDTDMGPSTQS